MKSRSLFLFVLLFSALGLTGCKSTKKAQTVEENKFNLTEAENQLRDIWVLEWMEDVRVDTLNFAGGIPTLELQPRDSLAIGTTGCNNLQTKLIVENKNKLQFKWLATTKMYCINSAEPAYIDYLTRITNYNREGLKLTLLEGEKPLLRYIKAD